MYKGVLGAGLNREIPPECGHDFHSINYLLVLDRIVRHLFTTKRGTRRKDLRMCFSVADRDNRKPVNGNNANLSPKMLWPTHDHQ